MIFYLYVSSPAPSCAPLALFNPLRAPAPQRPKFRLKSTVARVRPPKSHNHLAPENMIVQTGVACRAVCYIILTGRINLWP